jgi:hypothetical protein
VGLVDHRSHQKKTAFFKLPHQLWLSARLTGMSLAKRISEAARRCQVNAEAARAMRAQASVSVSVAIE